MAATRPELIYLSGPQQGERAVIMTNTAILGRQPGCDILIQEEYASRQHVRFDVTVEGVIMENLSSNGTRVNGKKYKSGKNILLDTGDVLAIGATTAILIVNGGDDPDLALAEYQNTHAAPAENEPPPPSKSPDSPHSEGGAKTAPIEGEQGQSPASDADDKKSKKDEKDEKKNFLTESDERTPAQIEEEEKRKKKRLYIILGGIYALLMVGLVIFLATRPTSPDEKVGSGDRPKKFTRSDIREMFNVKKPLQPERSPSNYDAAKALENARSYFETRDNVPNLYNCVYSFREYLAYQPQNKQGYENIKDEENAITAGMELTESIWKRYDDALMDEEQKLWSSAHKKFETIMQIVPCRNVRKDADAVKLFENIKDHSVYASKRDNRRR